MFQPKFARIDAPGWEPCGPGRDPSVLLDARVDVNDASLRLLAFRVPMPYSAGWSQSAGWEDDKGRQGQGLLWDVPRFIEKVRAADAPSYDLEDDANIPPDMDEPMAELAAAWRSVCILLGWPGQDWRPAIISGQPYIVIGHLDGPARGASVVINLEAEDTRTWVGMRDRQKSFAIDIFGSPCTITCVEVRALGAEGKLRVKALDATDERWLSEMDALAEALPGGKGARGTFIVGGKTVAGVLTPLGADAWTFDYRRFVGTLWPGLMLGRSRWALEIPLDTIDNRLARMLEVLAATVRARAVSRHEGDTCIAWRVGDAVKLFGAGDADTLKTAIFMRLGKVTLRGIGRSPSEGRFAHLGRVVTRVYVFNDAIYLTLSHAFARLADIAHPGAMLRLPEGGIVLETESVDPAMAPEWLEDAPPVADGRIRRLISDLAGL